MRKFFIFLIIIVYSITFSYSTKAQQSFSLKISITDSLQQPVAGATVLLKDSSFAKGCLTDSSGWCSINIPLAHQYKLIVNAVGYASIDTIVSVSHNSQLSFTLHSSANQLKEVIITSNKISITHQNEKFVIKWNNPAFVQGKTIWDVMKQSPLMNIENDQQISVFNNSNVVIFINGKRQYISGTALINLLKSLPSDDLQLFEIIPIAPAHYNAPPNATVINIVMKENKLAYTQGNITGAYMRGMKDLYELSATLAHQKKKLSYSVMGMVEITKVQYKQNSFLEIPAKQKQVLTHTTTDIYNNPAIYLNLNVGYTFNKHHELYLNTNFFDNNGSPSLTNNIGKGATNYLSNKNDNYVLDSSETFARGYYYRPRTSTNTINYTFRIDTLGNQKLEAEFSYIHDSQHDKSNYNFNSYKLGIPTEESNLFTDRPKKANSYFGRLAYTKKISNKLTFNIGSEITITKATSTTIWKTQPYNAPSQLIDSFLFIQKENTYTGFVNFTMNFSEKLSLVAGAKLYYSTWNSTKNKEDFFSNDYTTVTPTVIVGYSPSQKHQFNYTLQTGMDWPNFWSITPDYDYENANTTSVNNPFLKKNSYFKNLLTYTLLQKHIFTVYNNYQHHPRIDNNFIVVTPSDNILFTSTNVKFKDFFAAGYESQFLLLKSRWQLSPSAYFQHNTIKGKDSLAGLTNEVTGIFAMLKNIYFLDKHKSFQAELTLSYSSKYVEDFYRREEGRFTLNFSISKNLKNWNFRVAASDITKGSANLKYHYMLLQPATYYQQSYYDTRRITVSVRFNFGNKKISVFQPYSEGAGEIKGRLERR